ncbi:MAG: hypothetical protein ACRDDF_03645, partial [Aeromonas sp.]
KRANVNVNKNYSRINIFGTIDSGPIIDSVLLRVVEILSDPNVLEIFIKSLYEYPHTAGVGLHALAPHGNKQVMNTHRYGLARVWPATRDKGFISGSVCSDESDKSSSETRGWRGPLNPLP